MRCEGGGGAQAQAHMIGVGQIRVLNCLIQPFVTGNTVALGLPRSDLANPVHDSVQGGQRRTAPAHVALQAAGGLRVVQALQEGRACCGPCVPSLTSSPGPDLIHLVPFKCRRTRRGSASCKPCLPALNSWPSCLKMKSRQRCVRAGVGPVPRHGKWVRPPPKGA